MVRLKYEGKHIEDLTTRAPLEQQPRWRCRDLSCSKFNASALFTPQRTNFGDKEWGRFRLELIRRDACMLYDNILYTNIQSLMIY
jgi:hypothetical protein